MGFQTPRQSVKYNKSTDRGVFSDKLHHSFSVWLMCMSHLNIDGANLLLVYKDPRPAYLHPVLFMYEQIWFINSAPRPRASFRRILTVAICQSYLYPKMKHKINNVEQCLGRTEKCEYLWLWFIYLFWPICIWLCSSARVWVCFWGLMQL